MTPDVSGVPALDVLIGLAFVYFLLSLVTSALTEAVAGLFNLRFKTLKRGIREVLEEGLDKKRLETKRSDLKAALDATGFDEVLAYGKTFLSKETEQEVTSSKDEDALRQALQRKEEVLSNEASFWDSLEKSPRMQALWKQTSALTKLAKKAGLAKKGRGPSYIPPRVLVLSLLDTLDPPPTNGASHDLLGQAQAAFDNVESPVLKAWLRDALAEAEFSREKLLSSLETSFDGVMDRVSGWYKRTSTIWILVFSVLVAGAMNVDSYAIGKRLWQDEAVRSTIAAQATELTAATCPDDTNTKASADEQAKLTVEQAAKCVSRLNELGLPLGWGAENRAGIWEGYNRSETWAGVGAKVLGLLVTVFALMLGAPFWFDTLGKLARLRTTGKREGTAKSDERAAVDRDERRL